MHVSTIGCEHRTRIQSKESRLVLAKVNIQIRQLFPSEEFTRHTIDRLTSQPDSSCQLSFETQEITLCIEEGVRLRGLFHSTRYDLHNFHRLNAVTEGWELDSLMPIYALASNDATSGSRAAIFSKRLAAGWCLQNIWIFSRLDGSRWQTPLVFSSACKKRNSSW